MCAPTFLSAILSSTWSTVSASVVEWVFLFLVVCVVFLSFFFSFLLNCSGKTLSVLHTKPPTSPSLSLSSLLPQAAVFLSCLGTGAKLFFPYPCLTSRNSQTYRNTHTYSSCLSLPCPHTRLAVDCVLTSFWTRD